MLKAHWFTWLLWLGLLHAGSGLRRHGTALESLNDQLDDQLHDVRTQLFALRASLSS